MNKFTAVHSCESYQCNCQENYKLINKWKNKNSAHFNVLLTHTFIDLSGEINKNFPRGELVSKDTIVCL